MKFRKAKKEDVLQMLKIIKVNYPKKATIKEINEMFSQSLFKPTYIVAEEKKLEKIIHNIGEAKQLKDNKIKEVEDKKSEVSEINAKKKEVKQELVEIESEKINLVNEKVYIFDEVEKAKQIIEGSKAIKKDLKVYENRINKERKELGKNLIKLV